MAELELTAPLTLTATHPSQASRLWRRVRLSTGVSVGASILVVLIALTISASLLTSYDPIKINSNESTQPPNGLHPFGTDNFGRDILTRVLYGGRISLQVGVVSVALASVIGTLLGLLAAYYGRWVDSLIMRFIDVM